MEILVAILLFGLILVVSIKAYSYLGFVSQFNQLRYIALNKIDSEMSRLVFAYENFSDSNFSEDTGNTNGRWDAFFNVPISDDDDNVHIYTNNPLKNDFGLGIANAPINNLNAIELINIKNGIKNHIDEGDIVGIMAWKISKKNNDANISLSITYPYKVSSINNSTLFHGLEIQHLDGSSINYANPNYLKKETINLKTSTKIWQ